MRRLADGGAIDALAWTATRPASRSVRPLAVLAAAIVLLVGGSVAVVLQSVGLLVAVPLASYLTWQVARHLLAVRAVRTIRRQTEPLRAITVATLVTRGYATVRGTRYVAVQDADRVVLSTAGGGRRTELPPASIIGMSGGGSSGP